MKTFKKSRRFPSLLRRFGVVGFLFFLVKGLAWLAVPLVAARFL